MSDDVSPPVIQPVLLLIGLTILAAVLILTRLTSRPVPTPDSTPPPAEASTNAVRSTSRTPHTEPGVPFSDEDASQLMYTLAFSEDDPDRAVEALMSVVDSGDERFIAVLIELMRANGIGLLRGAGFTAHVGALEDLSGQSFGPDWPAWVEWYGNTDLVPPPNFATWKGQIYSYIDPRFADFLQSDYPTTIRVEEIQWGGVRVDGIPPLNNPEMITPDEADYLDDLDPVFGVEINGDARAYPLRIMDWHEMLNDEIGGVPISLAYCTLCGAAIPYIGDGPDGNTYTFGTSGFLYRSNKLMYDTRTFTLWNQLTGRPVLGPLAGTDLKLDFAPVVVTTWADWRAEHPDTTVLSLNTGHNRPYELGAAYGSYFASPETMFPVAQRSTLLEDKTPIYAITLDGVPKAYPTDVLAEEQVVNDTLNDTNLVLIAPRGFVTARGVDRNEAPISYGVGAEIRAYERGDHSFSPGPDEDTVLDASGDVWTITEEALLGPEGQSLPRISGHQAFWFGWFAFFPNSLVYGGSEN